MTTIQIINARCKAIILAHPTEWTYRKCVELFNRIEREVYQEMGLYL